MACELSGQRIKSSSVDSFARCTAYVSNVHPRPDTGTIDESFKSADAMAPYLSCNPDSSCDYSAPCAVRNSAL
jgi:hypothetical protein